MNRLQGAAKQHRGRLRHVLAGFPWNAARKLAFAPTATNRVTHAYAGDAEARDSRSRDDKRLVQFHYDASNDFYRLFLDAEMVYSCAYFEIGQETLAEAQTSKIDHILTKLRL
ncbi:MAG: class I SAM-dependent methyltransferase, partial [Geminicoccaceae bacterium]|nr:class I SAM-dependent methyltransferase [Geminicoccaceae bacterium]